MSGAILAMAALAALPNEASAARKAPAAQGDEPIALEYRGQILRDNLGALYRRYDLTLANTSDAPETFAMCPRDAKVLRIFRGRAQRVHGHAISLDRPSWSFDCGERTLAPGETVDLSVYFRPFWPYFRSGANQSVFMNTSHGTFRLRHGKVERIEETAGAAQADRQRST